jgi:hypothetical protein
VAVHPAPYPRPAFIPLPPRAMRRGERTTLPRSAVRANRLKDRSPRRANGAVRVTFAVTPIAPLLAVGVFAVAAVVALVRAVALVPAVDGRADPRRRHASRARIGRTGQRVGLGLAVIVVIFSVGLIYGDRTVQISARGVDLATLQSERDDLLRQQRTLENDLARLGSEVAVGHEALDQGLIRLGPPILIPAR